jgi:MSHA biogenesis protein MshO
MMGSAKKLHGFTMVELVVSITISALLAGFISLVLTGPVDAYFDQTARTQLSDEAQFVSKAFTTDLRFALPNSVRIRTSGSRSIIEFLEVMSVSIYRPTGTLADPPNAAADELDFGTPQDEFSVFGRLDPNAVLDAFDRYEFSGYLVVNNRGADAADDRNAYRPGAAANGVITPTGATFEIQRDDDNRETLRLPASFGFVTPEGLPEPQPLNRIFAVRGPVTYICDSNSRTLRKFEGYPINDDIPTSETSPQLTSATVTTLAANVSECNVRCGGPSENACEDVLILDMTVARATATERVRIFEQVPLDNAL